MSHEQRTEWFFSQGIEHYGTFHGNYLNFGLWEKGITNYVEAAEQMLRRVADNIALNQHSLLLDVACGMGAQDQFFMKTFHCQRIEALDLTTKHIELAKSRNTNSAINYVVGNAVALPYPNETFTHLTGIEGPVNFNTREDFFKEAQRVLQPGGRLGMSDFTVARPPRNAVERRLVQFCAWLWHIPWENADTITTYQAKLERNGFVSVMIEDVSHFAYPGYYFEQKKKETRKAMYSIRGPVVGRMGLFIDFVTYQLYKKGLIGYILVSAEKKK